MLRLTTETTAPAAAATTASGENRDARRHPRLQLPFMYTVLRARPEGTDRYRWTGHIYDLSQSGARFELDQAIDPGTRLDIRMVLPGDTQSVVTASGTVVRLHDDEAEPGPVRMAITFDRLATDADRRRLEGYLQPRLELRSAA